MRTIDRLASRVPTYQTVGIALMFANCVLSACSPGTSTPNDATNHPGDGSVRADAGNVLNSDVVGQVEVSTTLPAAPPLANVRGTQFGSNTWIDFDPVDNAHDYRVYVLPAAADISARSDGIVNIHNATYRCGGNREASATGPEAVLNTTDSNPEGFVTTHLTGRIDGYPYMRTADDATLGHVYTSDGADRVPVYALGDPSYNVGDQTRTADNSYGSQRWQASRAKIYTTSASERTMLLAQHWRDDGVQFWVPSAASASTRTLYRATIRATGQWSAYMIATQGAEHDSVMGGTGANLSAPTELFPVLTAAGTDTTPLMRVFYATSGKGHDELAVGQARFLAAQTQGHTPLNHLLWTGETGPTTLVVEALDSLCPYPGDLAPMHRDQAQWVPEPWQTLDEMRTASSTGEVYVNGQGPATNTPRAIARSFVMVQPATRDSMDWSLDFAHDALPLQEILPTMGFATHHASAPGMDAIFIFIEGTNWTYGSMLGEFWIHYTDVAADTNGKVRFTPTQMATLSQNAFIHAAFETDMVSSQRRYPQIFVSTALAPIQAGGNDYGPNHLATAQSVLVQPRGFWPYGLEVQRCANRDWDVNNQCPSHVTSVSPASSGDGFLTPAPEVSELSGVDRSARFDVFASATQTFVFMNGTPMGCADYSASAMPAGPVTVTFGDVLYHSDVDVPAPMYQFHADHLHRETRRHWDYIGFSSNVTLPAWDGVNMPCGTDFQM